jgi:hypothetical protein
MIQRAQDTSDGRGSGRKGAPMKDGDRPGQPSLSGDLAPAMLEPHASLRYVARLFKWLAALLLLLLVAETVLGLVQQGQQALPVLLVEATRLIVFAGVLWAFGDISLMLIESNHDLRATRLMVWQLNAFMKMRMDKEGIRVDPVRPMLDPRERPTIPEE